MYENWEQLKADCMECRKCSLCETRTNLVFGVGNENAEVMFIGEGPGENEDLQGEPFVGRGGKLLDKYLEAINLDRKKNIYIANMVPCSAIIKALGTVNFCDIAVTHIHYKVSVLCFNAVRFPQICRQ